MAHSRILFALPSDAMCIHVAEVTEQEDVQPVPTSRGAVSVRALGPEEGPAFLALSGLTRRGYGRDWVNAGVVTHLAGKRYRVLLPDPRTNRATAPSFGDFAVLLTVKTLYGRLRGAAGRTGCSTYCLRPQRESQSSSPAILGAVEPWLG